MTVVVIAVMAMGLVGGVIAANRRDDRRARFCDLMVEAFEAGDDRDAATGLTNRARGVLASSSLSDPSPESLLVRDWWYLRHGDGFLHGERDVGGRIDRLPRDAPATKAVGGTAQQAEDDLRALCADGGA